MIRPCEPADIEAIYAVVNAAAEAYRGVIPAGCFHEPYMPREELRHEIDNGVAFWVCEDGGELVGVMGIQDVADVTLVRHAYVRPDRQKSGVGGRLLRHLCDLTGRPTLVGTWEVAHWAIRFYEKHGFELLETDEKNRLLRRYWKITDQHRDSSVVLADANYRTAKPSES